MYALTTRINHTEGACWCTNWIIQHGITWILIMDLIESRPWNRPCNEPSYSIGLALNLASLQNHCLIVREFCGNSRYIVVSLLCGMPCGSSGHESIQIPCHKCCTEVFFPVCNIWMHTMVFRYAYIMLNIHIHKIY